MRHCNVKYPENNTGKVQDSDISEEEDVSSETNSWL